MLFNFLCVNLGQFPNIQALTMALEFVVIPFYNLQQCTQKQSDKIILNPNFNSHLSLNNLY